MVRSRRRWLFGFGMVLLGAFLSGCAARYIERADAQIAQVPVINGAVPQEAGSAVFVGAHANRSNTHSLRTTTRNRQPYNYGVTWNPTSMGFNFGARINASDGNPGKVSLIDLFAYFDGDPRRFAKNNAELIGAGVTTSYQDFRIRLATGIGRHQSDIKTILVNDPSSELCSQNCEITIDTSAGNRASLLFVWSATIWPSPYEKGSFAFAPYIGLQYGLQLISGQSATYGGSLLLRNPIFTVGIRSDWSSTAIVAEVHGKGIYNAHGGTSVSTAEIRLEQSLRIHKKR